MCVPKILYFASLDLVRPLKTLFKHVHELGYIFVFLGYLGLCEEILRNTVIVQQFVVIFFHCFMIYERSCGGGVG